MADPRSAEGGREENTVKLIYKFGDRQADVTATYNRILCNNMPRCHSHAEYELYYLTAGERYLFVSNRFYHVRAGDIFLIAPETDHRTLDVKSEPYTLLVMNIPPIHLPSDSVPCGGVHIARPDPKLSARLSEEAATVVRAVEGGTPDIDSYSAILRLLSLTLSAENLADSVTVASPTLDRVAEILKYIDSHFSDPINLVALSERFYLSEFYLCRLFKEYTGRTILDYITSLRIRHSKRLLSSTDMPIGRIARASGFGSVSAFGKSFKCSVGTTPREYRASQSAL